MLICTAVPGSRKWETGICACSQGPTPVSVRAANSRWSGGECGIGVFIEQYRVLSGHYRILGGVKRRGIVNGPIFLQGLDFRSGGRFVAPTVSDLKRSGFCGG
jgi:hypothetical protein